MPFDVQGARQSGYSDPEIADFLSKNHPNFDVQGAMNAGYSLDDISSELNNPTQKMGPLKAGALGLMSGIPLAETAIAGGEAALTPKTYEQAHQGLEAAKDIAWEQNPVAYGVGKTAGIVGTGLAAPASIPGAIAVGAASGLDMAKQVADMPTEALKGGTVGAVLGTIGEKVISPLINKALPTAGKMGLRTLGPEAEAIEARLTRPEELSAALTKPESSQMLAEQMNKLSGETSNLSHEARGLLNPEAAPLAAPEVPENFPLAESVQNPLKSIFDNLKEGLTVNGVPSTAANEAAIKALDAQYSRLTQIAEANGGQIPENVLGQVIRDIQHSLKDKVFGNPEASAAQASLAQLSGKLNAALKGANTEYAQAMEPVAERSGLMSDIANKFNLEQNEGAYVPTEATNTKIANVLNENKTESQELLRHLSNLTGFNFLKNAQDRALAAQFEPSGVSSGHGLSIVGHVGGYTAGKLSGLPGMGLIGSLIGGEVGRQVEGGQIAGKIIDTWLNAKNSIPGKALATYGPILINAAKQGGNQLAATHYVLATSHPDYQLLMNQVQEGAHE